jgi:hypothetical protein
MRKRLLTLCMALVFSASMAGVGMAAKCKGTVTGNEGGVMTIEVKGECDIDAGKDVTIKPKRGGAVEGC